MAVTSDLEAKLADFDRYSHAAVRYLIMFLDQYEDAIVHLARGRQVSGHFLYGDKLMYEYEPMRLKKELAEELADGIVYTSRLLNLMAAAARPEDEPSPPPTLRPAA